MKRIMVIFAVAALAGCASVNKARVENGRLVVDSPFDLEIGSTEYAKMLGDYLQSTTRAYYDPRTKVTTTNWSWHATCKLSERYLGCREVWLNFKDEDRHLDTYSFECGVKGMGSSLGGTMTLDECRKTVREIASEVESRHGIKMTVVQDKDNDAVAKMVDDMNKELADRNDGSRHPVTFSRAMSFFRMSSHNNIDGASVGVPEVEVTGMVGNDGKCRCSVNVSPSILRKKPEDPAVAKRRKAAHDEAAKLRKTIAKMFDVDLDAPKGEKKNGDPGKENMDSAIADAGAKSGNEWTKLENPCEGMAERKILPSNSFFGFTFSGLSLRRAYDGDVSEEELKTVAAEFLSRLEKAYGGKLPPADTEQGEKMLAKMYGEGVPAFGDSNAALQLERTNHFIGRVGDLAVEISYAVPQYAKKGDTFEIARRGGVLVNFVQTPILAEEKK